MSILASKKAIWEVQAKLVDRRTTEWVRWGLPFIPFGRIHAMRTALVFLALIGAVGKSRAQEGISPETLADIKRATVFVKVKAQGREGSGSGFVVRTERDSVLVVTNHHVVEPKIQVEVPVPQPAPGIPGIPLPPGWSPRLIQTALKNAEVTVVFESGTKAERSFAAEALALDPHRDLAILRVKKIQNGPRPIDFSRTPKLAETIPVYTFGFPFGKALSTNKGNPAITVGKAAISSLRLDEDGELALVQIDGSLNPGNSGGPVVDARGQLTGVAVATIRNSSGIGLAIPAADVRKMLQGRVGSLHLTADTPADGKTRVRAELAVIDPLKKITAIDLYYLQTNDERVLSKKIDSLTDQAGAKKTTLTIEKQLALGELTLDGDVRKFALLWQAVYTNDSGKDLKTRTARQTVPALTVAKGKPPLPPAKNQPPPEGATKILGGGLKDAVFTDEAPDGGILVGLDICLGTFATKEAITGIRPIYRTKNGDVPGKHHGAISQHPVTVKAKDGYAVSTVFVQASLPIFGMSVQFMRVKGGALDPDDSYLSKWVGGKTTAGQKTLGGDGVTVVGIVGKLNSRGDCSGIGLLLKNADRQP